MAQKSRAPTDVSNRI